MKNGDQNSNLARRIDLISSLEYLLKESIYYRTHSNYFDDSQKIVVASINSKENKTQIL